MGYDGAFLSKSVYVRCLFAEVAFRNKKREVGILVARLLKPSVEFRLHALPNGVAVRLDDHAAAHARILSEIRLNNELVVPFAVVDFARREILRHYLV